MDVEHFADGWSDIHDVGWLRGLTVIDVPAKEHEGDVGIVGIPHAVGGAHVVGLVTHVLPTSLRNDDDVTATCRIVAVGDAFAQKFWHCCGECLLKIDYIDQFIDFLEFLDDCLLHLVKFLAAGSDVCTIEEDASCILTKDDLLFTLKAEVCFDGLLNHFQFVPHFQTA